jgi:hypothetical protein
MSDCFLTYKNPTGQQVFTQNVYDLAAMLSGKTGSISSAVHDHWRLRRMLGQCMNVKPVRPPGLPL